MPISITTMSNSTNVNPGALPAGICGLLAQQQSNVGAEREAAESQENARHATASLIDPPICGAAQPPIDKKRHPAADAHPAAT
jgi:hypothetical protein